MTTRFVGAWDDPAVNSIGRLPMGSVGLGFASIEEARASDPYASVAGSWRRDLGGRWDLRLLSHPDLVTADVVTGDTRPVDGWRPVAVPGNWTMQDVVDERGDPDLPAYLNIRMPFPGPPPETPDRVPTGVYRRSVNIPRRWLARRVVLHIGGAESTHTLVVNGQVAGSGTDSRLPSEYDITELVTAGRNDLAVIVTKYGAHSYIEDQDQWWMGGLHREIAIEARPVTRVTDLACTADLEPSTGTGRLTVRTTVGGHRAPDAHWTVRVHVEDTMGARLVEPAVVEVPWEHRTPYVFTGHHADATFEIPDVAPWSAELPTLHHVLVELIDHDGTVVEVHRRRVGFRRIEIADRRFLVNGRPVWIFGVNRHDHHPTRGKAVTVDDMRDDLLAMKRLNVNAIRTAHYPADHRLYDLADELGFYVVDEANIECHAYNTSLCDDGRYLSAWVERVARMVVRDRSHPSVVFWSLGNEAGYGVNHDAAAGAARRLDPTRPLHYEGAVFHAGWVDGGTAASDVVCPMYPTIDAIREYGESSEGDRPLIMCEYQHAMGNSNGSLADYWDVITSTDGLQGGFIWEWKDHGLRTTLPNGKRGLAYGGQFGEPDHDGNFVADGLMSADLVPHPAAQEVTWVHRPVTVEAASRGRLRITNRRFFTGLDDLVASWELLSGGRIVDSGDWHVDPIAPGESVVRPLPCERPSEPDSHLTLRWAQRHDTPWAPAGHLVAWDQIELRAPARARNVADPIRARADGDDGGQADGSSHQVVLVRAPVDNDGFKLMPDLARNIGVGGRALMSWEDAGLTERPATEFVTHHHEVADDERGVVHDHVIVVSDDVAALDLGRIGVRFELPARFVGQRWCGRGPLENYPDRNRGAVLGVWEQDASDPMPYLVPQEFGLRTDCRWWEFVDPTRGETVRLDALVPGAVHVSATRYRHEDLWAAEHSTDLRRHRRLVVHIDVAHRGLGTASCGPDVLDRYRIAAGEYRLRYRLSHAR